MRVSCAEADISICPFFGVGDTSPEDKRAVAKLDHNLQLWLALPNGTMSLATVCPLRN